MSSFDPLNVLSVVIAASSLVVSAMAFYRLVKLDRSGKFRELGDAIDKIEGARVIGERTLGERISRVEGALQHIPTAEQMSALRHELTKAEAAIAGVNARIEGVDDILKSHENRILQIFEDALSRGRSAARSRP
ncbi:MAG: hypothetical protein WAW54_17550 [Parvibaculum sedimenti]|uniref:hypothetical protein n=1 Tax=Parvibaculum sedimenti TaxID=2608632 RepID=UPI003BB7CD61